MLRIPHYLENWLTDVGKVCQSYILAALYSPRNIIIFMFLVLISVRAELTPGPSAAGRIR
jgi:hypothetical protein